MHLISGDTLMERIQAQEGSLVRWMADTSLDDPGAIERIFLTALVRPPSREETLLALEPILAQGLKACRRAFEDTFWAVMNSREFSYNH